MKAVADALEVARSHLHEKVRRLAKPRGSYRKPDDGDLLPLIRRLVDERPTYGYRRITALANRELVKTGKPMANHKRIFRIMRQNGMLLARHTGRRKGRLHDGKVVVMRSNLRWCSDGFEHSCWNGDLVRLAFIIDAHDREIIAWHAVANAGISGSMVRDMMLEAVESRFAAIQAPHALEWLTDNGSVYTAHETRAFAQHRRAGERKLQMQPVEPSHDRKVGFLRLKKEKGVSELQATRPQMRRQLQTRSTGQGKHGGLAPRPA